jgi:quercetin dioxygenase-like cupin family protein
MATAAIRRDTVWSPSAMAARLVRYADLRPCYNAFIDTRSPGSEAKENFTIIGPGVSENPDQHVHIAEPHGFNIGGARQPPGCVNSQHSHDTAEVFVVHTGQWRFDIGERGDDVQLVCNPGDVISLPTGMFRGFTNIGDDTAYLFAILGSDDPGRVLWAPDVFDMAAQYGLVLLESGELIDTVAGQTVPDNARTMPRTTREQVASMWIPTPKDAVAFVWRNEPVNTAIIGDGAPLGGNHGFTLDRIIIAAGETGAVHSHSHAHVVFVHAGSTVLHWDGGSLELGIGDTMSVPPGLPHWLSSATGATLFIVGR